MDHPQRVCKAAFRAVHRQGGRPKGAEKLLPFAQQGRCRMWPQGGPAPRSTHERLQATLRKRGKKPCRPACCAALLEELQAIVAPQVSEVEGRAPRPGCSQLVCHAEPEERRDMWLLMSEQFAPTPRRFKAQASSTRPPRHARRSRRPRCSTAAPGVAAARLLQRFSVNPEGIRFLVDMRAEMQPT
jgi:malonyl-CoA decarboxylase